MTALIPFTTWTARFTDAEYALFRHRMRAVQFIGGNITRRWDQATATNNIDLGPATTATGFLRARRMR